jgi:hypothetical protein
MTQLGDKKVTYNPDYFSYTPPSALPPIGTIPPGTIFTPQVDISYSWIPGGFGQPRDNDFSNDSWLIEVGAANSPFVGDFGITYGFDVEIVSGPDDSTPPFDADGTNWVFDRVGLAVDANQLPVSGQRVVKAVNGITGAVTTFEFELVNVNEVPVGDAIKTLSGNYKKISIIDSITIPAGATLTSVSNAWTQRPIQTPGPVAIAGAATAFGFSRRLRNRVKAAKAS